MKIQCPTCPHTVRGGYAYLATTHVCENAVDPANDPRRPRDDDHADEMERQRLGIRPRQ